MRERMMGMKKGVRFVEVAYNSSSNHFPPPTRHLYNWVQLYNLTEKDNLHHLASLFLYYFIFFGSVLGALILYEGISSWGTFSNTCHVPSWFYKIRRPNLSHTALPCEPTSQFLLLCPRSSLSHDIWILPYFLIKPSGQTFFLFSCRF